MHQKIPQKIQFLKFVAEQGVVSAQDINRYFFKEDKIDVIISTLYQLGVSRLWYGKTYGGVWKIGDPKLYKLLKIYYPDLWDLKVSRMTGTNLVPHFLEMNRIRTVFEKSGHFDIALWLSERVIRALPVKQRSDICPAKKPPDAVFWIFKEEGGQKKYFLECERHFNSTERRYVEIFESYERREDAHHGNVVFLCGNKRIQRRLLRIQSRYAIGNDFKFLTLEGFYNKYEKAVVTPGAKVEATQTA